MATVYLARKRSGTRSFVALKVIHAHLLRDPEFVAMFRDEAAIASQISHGNVCRVLDFGAAAQEHYIVMEFLAGESLAAVWRRLLAPEVERPSGPRMALLVGRMLSDACEGLHAAHELTAVGGEPLGVVHRDVSPENVMLTYEGSAKLLDFGVATATRQHHQTRTGMVKGKFAYIAPELLGGSKPDRRADVWGMGATAWELLTGHRLFHAANDLDTLHAVTELPIRPPSELAPGIPPAMDEVVLRALSRDPEGRYASARELGSALLRASAKDGEVASLGDLAEWVQSLFPTGPEQTRALLDRTTMASATVEPERTPHSSGRPRSRTPSRTLPSHPAPPTTGVGFLSSVELEEGEPTRFVKPRGRALITPLRRYVSLAAALAAGLCLGHLLHADVRGPFFGADLRTGPAAPTKTTVPGATGVVESATGASFVSIEQAEDRLILRVDGRTVEIRRPSGAATPVAAQSPADPRALRE